MNMLTRAYKKQTGLTLIELMVAMTLSLILLAGVIQIFISNKSTYRMGEAMARVQENGRFAMNFVSTDFRMAGLMGCAGVSGGVDFQNHAKTDDDPPNPYGDATDILAGFDGSNSILGYDNAANPLPAYIANLGLAIGTGPGNLVAGTDVIILRSTKSCPGGNVVEAGTGTAQIKIADATACGLLQDDIVMVSNCKTAEIFGITNVPQNAGADKDTLAHAIANNSVNTLSGFYDTDSNIYKLQSTAYYIAYGASGEPSLFRISLSSGGGTTAEELVEGIENMQITYGEDTDTDPDGAANRYIDGTAANFPDGVDADTFPDFDNVVSLRVCLASRTTQDNVASENLAYDNCGVAVADPGDRRIRKLFKSTIAARNLVR